MPAALEYILPGDTRRTDFTNLGGSEREARTKRYTLARDYYEGRQKSFLNKKEGEPDDNTVLNLVKMTIDRTGAFLFAKLPKFEINPEESEDTPEELWLKDVWEASGGVALLNAMYLNGAWSGHVYVRIRPQDGAFPRIINLDPTKIITYWQADDIENVIWHEMRWKIGNDEFLIDFVNTGISWLILEYEQKGGTGWNLVRTTHWDTPFGPIVHWQHLPNPNQFYGYGEFTSPRLQDSVNLAYSEMQRILRYHSSPRTVIIGAEVSDVKPTAIDKAWSISEENARVENLEMQSELVASQTVAQAFYDTYLAENRVVLLRGEVKDFQRVTNTGVRTVFMDMLSKNNLLRETYKRGMMNINYRLGLVGLQQSLVAEPIYADPLPTDRLELVNTAAIERNMQTVSRETVSLELGRNWSNEVKKMTQEENNPVFQAAKEVQTQNSNLTQQ